MYDLIYLDDDSQYRKAQEKLKAVFPDAKFEDASDFIHHTRFSISINVPDDEYHIEILDLGLSLCSLNFQLLMQENTPKAKRLVDLWKETRVEKESLSNA